MPSADSNLPLIDISPYLKQGATEEDRKKVIAKVRDACVKYGFFQLIGHGIPIQLQREFLVALDTLFSLSKEEKLSLSFLNSPCRRGYEASGMTLRDGDAMPDSKEVCF
jgi:isopenicillin N synthase-like dioxygenase